MDWSARATPSPKRPSKDAIFLCARGSEGITHPRYHRTRASAVADVRYLIQKGLSEGERIFVGFDFAFGYPRGFAKGLTGKASGLAVWEWLTRCITDDPQNANNRFDVAEDMNRRFPGTGPFWGCPPGRASDELPMRGSARADHGLPERRAVEALIGSAQPVWKLFTTGSVGSQSLLGLPHLWQLKRHFGDDLAIWPLETGWHMPKAPVTLAEIYPSMMRQTYDPPLDRAHPDADYDILDACQVRWVVDTIAEMQTQPDWAYVFNGNGCGDTAREEGWIFGAQVGTVAP